MDKIAKLDVAIKLLADIVGPWIIEAINSQSASTSSPHPGSLWITSLDGKFGTWKGMVVSAYYHPTKKHTATTEGKLGVKRSVAEPGQWAISTQTRGLFGNKCYYNTLDS